MNSNTPNGPTSLHEIDIDHINATTIRPRPPAGRDSDGWPRSRIVRDEPVASITASGAGSIDVTGPDTPTSLAELVDLSDAVVLGHVTAVEPGRVFGPASSALHYASVTVSVAQTLSGSLAAADRESLILEVPLWDGPATLARLRDGMLGTDRILFLRSKAATAVAAGMDPRADAGRYRLVTFGSEIVSVNGSAAAPLDDSDALAPFDGQAFPEVIAELAGG